MSAFLKNKLPKSIRVCDQKYHKANVDVFVYKNNNLQSHEGSYHVLLSDVALHKAIGMLILEDL